MGGGGYSFQDRQVRAATQNYAKKICLREL